MLNLNTRRFSAFTLIELLVVIAIIAILAAILFPVFARARENARRSSCQSNLKQTALGFRQYTQDYDEKFPLRYSELTGSTAFEANAADQGWGEVLQPYLKSTQIFQCPSETNGPAPAGSNNVGYTDYWYNNALTGRSEAIIDASALCVLMGDGSSSNSSLVSNDDGNATAELASIPGNAAQRHLEGANYAFADGHVKWLKAETTSQSSKVYDDDLTTSTTPSKSNVISLSP